MQTLHFQVKDSHVQWVTNLLHQFKLVYQCQNVPFLMVGGVVTLICPPFDVHGVQLQW